MRVTDITLFTTIVCLMIAGCEVFENERVRIEFVNRGYHNIKKVEISACNDTIAFENVDKHEVRKGVLKGHCGQSAYRVAMLYEDGSTLDKEFGYVSSGLNANTVIWEADKYIEFDTEVVAK